MQYLVITVGCFLSFIVGVKTAAETDTWGLGMQSKDLISECQKELPRSKNCKIIAVRDD